MHRVTEAKLGATFEPGGVVAVGWYDGVHRGHRRALDHLRSCADARGVATGLVLLDDDHAARRLTSIEQRLELLRATGAVDVVWVVHAPVDAWSGHAPTFIRDVLFHRVKAGAIVTTTGPSQGPTVQAFGQQLIEHAEGADIRVISLDDAVAEWDEIDRRCSSTAVAELLDAGDVADAAALLGRCHEMTGVVERGDQRGRTLGFPTANVGMPVSFVIPAEAVYAGTLTAADGVTRPTAISLGRRPTFYPDGLTLLEAHVLDFDGELYGQQVSVRFIDKVRRQHRFAGPDELVAQLRDDVRATREVVAAALAT